MFGEIKKCWNDKLWKLSFLGTVILGFAVASVIPYRSIIGIERLGLTEIEFATAGIISAVMAVMASIWAGIYSDQTGRYRDVMLVSLFLGVLGNASVYLFATKWAFILTYILLFPIASTAFTQFFALAKLAVNKNKELNADFSSSWVRAAYAGSYAITPPIWAILIANGVDIITIYGVSSLINIIMMVITYFKWPEEHRAIKNVAERTPFFANLRELADPSLAIRIFLVAILGFLTKLNSTVMGLIILNDLGGTESDVGWFAGLVAAVEIPVMVLSAVALRYVTKPAYMFLGVALYGSYLAGYSLLPSADYIWFLIPLAAIGGGIFIAVMISYVQDLVSDKPGTGGTLIAFTNIGGHMMAALVFGVGTIFTGYTQTAMIGSAIAITAALALLLADGGKVRQLSGTSNI